MRQWLWVCKRHIARYIGYFGLEEWWLTKFTDEERRYIRERYQPLGSSGDTLTSGNISHTSQNAVDFLQNHEGHDAPIRDEGETLAVN